MSNGRPLRLAFLDSWLDQAFDGSGTAVAIGGLARTLRARGHTVERIVPLSAKPSALTLRRLWYNWKLPSRLRAADYDAIIGFDIDGVRWAASPGATPYICSIKGVIAEEQRHERGLIRALLWSLSRLERLNARRAPLIISTSDYCRRQISAHYAVPADKVVIVPEGIDLSAWPAPDPALREPATVLCVARQYPRKHIADLIRAWPSVRAQVPAAKLVIIGDGPEHTKLAALAQGLGLAESVALLGALPDDAAVREWYRRATVFCLPSVQEGFGIVFLEAMAAGLPIVATTAAAIPEVVPDGVAGLLVPPADVAALAAALTRLLKDPELAAQLGAAGRDHVQRYDWEQVADRFLAVLGYAE